MKRIVIALSILTFLCCDNKTSPLDSRNDLEKAKECIIGKWETEPDTELMPGAEMTISLQFGTTFFDFNTIVRMDNQVVYEQAVKGNYIVDSPKQISVVIVEGDSSGAMATGKHMFWEIKILTKYELILCFEPDINNPIFYKFTRPD